MAAVECSACDSPDTQKMSVEALQTELATRPLWTISEDKALIERKLVAKNFKAAFDFLEKVGVVAEEQGHHPDLHLESYRNVRVCIYTHSVGGLTVHDFKLADAIDKLPCDYSPKFLKEQTARLA